MRKLAMTAAALLLLSGCGEKTADGNSTEAAKAPDASAQPLVKRQPGSWSQTVEIVRMEGKDVTPAAKQSMQQKFNMMNKISVCLTPEAVAREDIAKNLERIGTNGRECTFDKRNLSGDHVDFSGTCKSNGKQVRISASGTTGATAQDLTVKVEPLDNADAAESVMEMHITSARFGDCKPGDITPPAKSAE